MKPAHTPLVSVVIPCHNSRKTIALSVLSALHQTHPSIEVIVVDDASTDDTPEIVKKLGCTLIELTDNVGAGPARNRGIAASSGDILFFLDSDVALAPDAVANAVKIFEENPSYGAVWGVYGDRPLVDDGVVEWVQVLYGHYRATRKLGPARTGHFASGAVPRRVIDDIGAFDERLLGQYANEDHEFSSGSRSTTRSPAPCPWSVTTTTTTSCPRSCGSSIGAPAHWFPWSSSNAS